MHLHALCHPISGRNQKRKLAVLNDDIIKGSFWNVVYLILIPVIANIPVLFNWDKDHFFLGPSKSKD